MEREGEVLRWLNRHGSVLSLLIVLMLVVGNETSNDRSLVNAIEQST